MKMAFNLVLAASVSIGSFGISSKVAAESGNLVTCGSYEAAMQSSRPFDGLRYLKIDVSPLIIMPTMAMIAGVLADANGEPERFHWHRLVTKVERISNSTVPSQPIFKLAAEFGIYHAGRYVSVAAIQMRHSDAVGGWVSDLLDSDGISLVGTGIRACQIDLDLLKELARITRE